MKSEKGYTGIDIAISVIVLFIFVSLIATVFYKFNSSSKETKLKAKATAIAVEEIEKIKNKTISDIETEENTSYRNTTEIEEGLYRTITVQDYHDIDKTKVSGLVKKVTVQIQYMFKGKGQTVELSTIISKER